MNPSCQQRLEGEETSSEEYSDASGSRDEVAEVRKVAGRDTFNVVVWRSIATCVLLVTAVAVTSTTYYFLQDQQNDSFHTQFKQFSRTVADSAMDQQKRSRLAFRSMSAAVTATAQTAGAEWPFFIMPFYEEYASHTIKQANAELSGLVPLVRAEQREEYVAFVNRTYEDMIKEAHMIRSGSLDRLIPEGYPPFIGAMSPTGAVPDIEREYYMPILHFSPAPLSYGFTNLNLLSFPILGPALEDMVEMKIEQVLTAVRTYEPAIGISLTEEEHMAMHENVFLEESEMGPHAALITPVYEKVGDHNSTLVAELGCTFAWDVFMTELLPEGVNGITVVLENSCHQVYTYEINGPKVRYIGEGDFHERQYDSMMTYQDLSTGFYSTTLYETLNKHCRYAVRIYPTSKFEDSLDPHIPKVFAVVVACTFVVVALVFFIYDVFVQRRNELLVANNAQSNAIVSSLFPSNIRDRLLNPAQNQPSSNVQVRNLKSFMSGTDGSSYDNKPLADLFLECTVLFADIAGFTAWSSVREPTQVFTFLETVYGAFDAIAKRRRVFKVETVGDCYVAATGMPTYRKDHAVLMIRFARDILAKMSVLAKELEMTLGPDTGDLSLRVGIHTGPVTAGVLRGERARFQLFGDTVNVCSRIEATGLAGRIHISGETSDLLRKNGKTHWIVKREGIVAVKGKGEIQTYWIGAGVEIDAREGSTHGSSCIDATERANIDAVFEQTKSAWSSDAQDAKISRLVEWNVEMLSQIMKLVVARRNAMTSIRQLSPEPGDKPLAKAKYSDTEEDFRPLDNVKEIIQLPEFDALAASRQEDQDGIDLPEGALEQLREYVSEIAGMYHENSFHNFEHASHVTMSVIKLLSRIVAPTEQMEEGRQDLAEVTTSIHATLHDHTYGITSDPLTQFSCAFAAMIHDVDHSGVPNAQLVKEESPLAVLYNNRSVAEQNSLVLAWEMLMRDQYDQLRHALCPSIAELDRFQQLVVNAVMATDIVDKELKALRNGRWDKAFKNTQISENDRAATNRKATIVIEHLIQASDVAHTMQHWHVYRKWNENFFRECYQAYLAGRAETDPSESWYKGEMGFFDFYIIPLAKKLKECGVFGKSSDEYLTYAMANRREWEQRGESVVAEMVEAIRGESEP